MKAELTLKLGNKLFKVSGEGTYKEIVKNMSFWTQLPEVCDSCKSTKIGLQHRGAKTKEGKPVDYYGLKCLDCGAELTFHEKMEGKGFYLTYDDKFEKYQANTITQTQIEHAPINDPDSIPF
jgi:hypothetical protein